MKINKLISALAASIMIIGISGASAQTLENPERTYTLPNFTVEGVSDPVLETYVTPRIPTRLVGSDITMYYTIGKDGSIRSIRSNAFFWGSSDLAALMTNALKQWKFEPATNNAGEPVAIRVAMPVQVVSQGSAENAYLSINAGGIKLTVKAG